MQRVIQKAQENIWQARLSRRQQLRAISITSIRAGNLANGHTLTVQVPSDKLVLPRCKQCKLAMVRDMQLAAKRLGMAVDPRYDITDG